MSGHAKAREWRERNRYTRRQIAEMTGYSESSVHDFESGFVGGDPARPVNARALSRYRLCLAAIAHGLSGWDFVDPAVSVSLPAPIRQQSTGA